MKSLILFAALFADPEMMLRAENELLKAKIAALEAALAQEAPARREFSDPPAGSTHSSGATTPQPPAAAQDRPAVQTLRERIRAYRDSGGEPWYVRGKTDVQHLIDDHGWSSSELRGLTVAELQLLHGASHTGRIVPGKTATIVAVSEPQEVIVYSPASFNCPACNAWRSVSIPGVEIKHVRKDWSGWRSYPVVKVNGRHYYSPTVEQVKAMLE